MSSNASSINSIKLDSKKVFQIKSQSWIRDGIYFSKYGLLFILVKENTLYCIDIKIQELRWVRFYGTSDADYIYEVSVYEDTYILLHHLLKETIISINGDTIKPCGNNYFLFNSMREIGKPHNLSISLTKYMKYNEDIYFNKIDEESTNDLNIFYSKKTYMYDIKLRILTARFHPDPIDNTSTIYRPISIAITNLCSLKVFTDMLYTDSGASNYQTLYKNKIFYILSDISQLIIYDLGNPQKIKQIYNQYLIVDAFFEISDVFTYRITPPGFCNTDEEYLIPLVRIGVGYIFCVFFDYRIGKFKNF